MSAACSTDPFTAAKTRPRAWHAFQLCLVIAAFAVPLVALVVVVVLLLLAALKRAALGRAEPPVALLLDTDERHDIDGEGVVPLPPAPLGLPSIAKLGTAARTFAMRSVTKSSKSAAAFSDTTLSTTSLLLLPVPLLAEALCCSGDAEVVGPFA